MIRYIASLLVLLVVAVSCKKEGPKPPTLGFNNNAGYTYGDKTVAPNSTLTVGFVASRTDEPLSKLIAEADYDGAGYSEQFVHTMIDGEQTKFERAFNIKTRSVAGTEIWRFTVMDAVGTKASVSFTLTVR